MNIKYIIAGFLIILGVGLLMDQYHIWTFGSIISTWWPLFLIGIGLSSIMNKTRSIWSGVIILLVGVLFQADKLNFLPGSVWGYFWPMLLILIGAGILLSKNHKNKAQMFKDERSTSEDSYIQINSLFSGVEHKVNSTNFRGGKIDCSFGGVELDLRNIQIAPEGAELNISVAFGGVEIRIPSDIRCEVKGTPFLGGFEDKTNQTNIGSSQVLRIKYSVVFGGLEIQN